MGFIVLTGGLKPTPEFKKKISQGSIADPP